VFADLARKAAALVGRAVLSGWLYRSAQFAATDVVRSERRRRAREQETHLMNEISASAGDTADWEKLRPILDQVMGELSEEQKTKLLAGVDIEGESCKFDSLDDRGGEGSNHWYHVILREGKNREVRRMMEAVGLMVSRLMRVRFGTVELPGHIKRGMMREMEEAQIQDLLTFAGMNEPPPAPNGEETAEDEFDNIGNRVTEANRDRRGEEESALSDDLGNRVDARENIGNRDNGGSRGGDTAQHEPDGNRGTYGEGHRAPQQPNQRRPHGAKPFGFGKKRGAGRGPQGPGAGQGHPQGKSKGKGKGHPGQGQPHGQHRAHREQPAPLGHVAPEPLKAWVAGEG